MEERRGRKKGLRMLKKRGEDKERVKNLEEMKGRKKERVKNVEEDKTKKGLRIWKRGEEARKV